MGVLGTKKRNRLLTGRFKKQPPPHKRRLTTPAGTLCGESGSGCKTEMNEALQVRPAFPERCAALRTDRPASSPSGGFQTLFPAETQTHRQRAAGEKHQLLKGSGRSTS